MKEESKVTVYDIITDRICAILETGVAPWQKPWRVSSGQLPSNYVSKKAYRGINVFLLLCAPYECPYWVTFKEVSEFEAITSCESIVKGMPNAPVIRHSGSRAYYAPALDLVNMPAQNTFERATSYYSTLFHELIHSTGHKSRLARKGFLEGEEKIAAFGGGEYSREELVAEMGASFLCGHAGILHETVNNSASYCASWIKVLKGDSKLIVSAAAQAQKASDYILGVTFGEEKAE